MNRFQVEKTQKSPPGLLSDVVKDEILEAGGSLARNAGKMEIIRSHVVLGEIIGEGAFGDVYKATAHGITKDPVTTVAVKILKGTDFGLLYIIILSLVWNLEMTLYKNKYNKIILRISHVWKELNDNNVVSKWQ